MILLIDVEPPFDGGVVTMTFATVNSNHDGVEIQTADHDLNGVAFSGGVIGNTPDDKTEMMVERIQKNICEIIEEELGDNVCKEMR